MPTRNEMRQVTISKGVDLRNLYDSVINIDGVKHVVVTSGKTYIEVKRIDDTIDDTFYIAIEEDNSNAYH